MSLAMPEYPDVSLKLEALERYVRGHPLDRVRLSSPILQRSVDTPLDALPAVHIHVASKARWQEIDDAATQFDEMPPPDRFGEFFL